MACHNKKAHATKSHTLSTSNCQKWYNGFSAIITETSQMTSLTIIYSTVNSGADQTKKHQSSASLAFVWGIHRRPVNSPHKWPVTRKMFPFDDVIMMNIIPHIHQSCSQYLHICSCIWSGNVCYKSDNTRFTVNSCSFRVKLYLYTLRPWA